MLCIIVSQMLGASNNKLLLLTHQKPVWQIILPLFSSFSENHKPLKDSQNQYIHINNMMHIF